MIYQLIYSSVAASPMSRPALDDLLRRARLKNSRMGITGALLYHDGHFIQALEGKEAIVTTLLARIGEDRRHGAVRVLHASKVPRREFAGWSMAYRPIRKTDVDLRELFRLVASDDPAIRARGDGVAAGLLRSFYDSRLQLAAA